MVTKAKALTHTHTHTQNAALGRPRWKIPALPPLSGIPSTHYLKHLRAIKAALGEACTAPAVFVHLVYLMAEIKLDSELHR